MKLSFDRITNAIGKTFRDTLNKFIGEVEENFTETVANTKKAQDDAAEALSKVNEAKTIADNAQKQVNTLVVQAGESSPQVLQALTNSAGETFDTLKEVLDDKDDKIGDLSAVKADKTYVDAQVYSKRDKTTKLALEDMDDTVISALTGGTTVNVLSIPQNGSVSDEKVVNVSFDKITQKANVGASFNDVYENLTLTKYPHFSTRISSSESVSYDGLLKLNSYKNDSVNEIENVTVNSKKMGILLPGEYISNGQKFSMYDQLKYKSLNVDSATTLFDVNAGVRLRLAIPNNSYQTSTSMYNAFSSNNKFIPEKQANFATNTGNYIGFHNAFLITLKFTQAEVEGAGFTYDDAGVKGYAKTLSDFDIYIRRTNYTQSAYNVFFPVKAGSVVIDKKSTTAIEFDYYVSDVLKKDNYNYSEYSASVTNRTNIAYVDKVVKIYASFKQGECKDESCIVVKLPNGTIIPHQWDDDRHVNYKYDRNMGRHPDGTLKDGYINIIDSFVANESKEYQVLVYEDKVSNLVKSVSKTDTTDVVTFNISDLQMNFFKNKKYLLNEIIEAGVTKTFLQDPAYNKDLTTTIQLSNDPNTTVKKYFINGNGVIFYDFNVILTNSLFDYVLQTRVFKNKTVVMKGFFKTNRFIAGTEINSMFSRLNIKTGDVNHLATALVLRTDWVDGVVNKAAHAIFTHGDLPRDPSNPPRPTYPIFGKVIDSSDTTVKRIILGWQYGSSSTQFDIPENEVFASGMVVNLGGFSDSPDNETTRIFNGLIGRITKSTKFKLKSDIMKLITEDLVNVNPKLQEDYPTLPLHPSRLALWKMFGYEDLDTISASFKSHMSSTYGGNTVDPMWNKYITGSMALSKTSRRLLPPAEMLLKEYTKLNNTTEITYYQTLIKSYAEVLCKVYEERGFTPLLYSANSYNSNAIATGLRGLAAGIKLEPTNTRWINAYNGNKQNLLNCIPVTNTLTDSPNQNLPISHYLHYTSYAAYDYQKATESMNESPALNLINYTFNGTSAYGGMKEQEYCISSSRRGLGHTAAYIVYLLIKENEPSTLEQAKKILERIIEQNYPSGGHKYPLEDWRLEPAADYETSAPFEMQVLAETLYSLLDENIRTNY
ncbi:hypothetical protein ABEW81_11340 [Priestia megaterium]